VVGVHGKSGSPRIEVKTGPYSLFQKVRDSFAIEPSGWRTSTVTSSEVISRGCPSTRYVVGDPGARRSSIGVKRKAVETVWLQARFSV
jgi:hypothetical protein